MIRGTRIRRYSVPLIGVVVAFSMIVVARPGLGSPLSNDRLLIRQISKAPDWSSGEGWVMANPRNSDALTAAWTSFPFKSPLAAIETPPGPHPVQCGVGYSTDGGRTWVEGALPFQPVALPTNPGGCADPTLAADPNGTIYALSNGGSVTPGAGTTAPSLASLVSLSVSRDAGRTWSAPTKVWSFDDTPGNTLKSGSPDLALDRPWLVIDPVTSTMYASLSDDVLVERVVLASHDHGVTWGTAHPLDPDGQSVWADVPAASRGVLAAAYTVDPGSISYRTAPSPAVKCNQVCAVFETSTDDGKSWRRAVMPAQGLAFASGSGPEAPGLEVAADPSGAGRYAVVIPKSSRSLEVWLTRDGGATWTRALTVNASGADALAKPWIAFGSTGALGVVWREMHADNSYEANAAVSTDGGETFGPRIQLAAATAPPDGVPEAPGDDCACNVLLNGKYLYTTWADSRSGQRQIWFGRYRY